MRSDEKLRFRPRDFESFLRKRVAKQPGDASARLALGGALAAKGETAEGIAAVRQVLEADPDDLAAHRSLARLLLADGREQEALKAYEELLEALERRGLFARPERME